MNAINFIPENGTLRISLGGRIDSSCAAQVENDVKRILSENPAENVLLDLDDLEYISSAGLRVFLQLRKKNPSLRLVNVSPEVFNILEMTGFTEIIPIEKAYRKISVEGCEIIGKGANGTVYRLDPETIVKVYVQPDALPDIQNERELARRAFVLGIPTAISYDIVRVDGCYGSVFELLNADSVANILQKDPSRVEEGAQICIDLLKIIHGTEVSASDMPEMKAVALDWANFLRDYLPADAANRLVQLISDVPEDHHIIHGDYHIKNVMVQNGEALLIDMDTLCYGHPVFEFASMFNAYKGFRETDPNQAKRFLGISSETANALWNRQLCLYFGTDDEAKLKKIEDKARLIGYARLMRRSIRRKALDTEEGRKKVEHYKNNILSLLDTVDSLTF